MALTRAQYGVLANAWLLGFSMYATFLNISPIMSIVKDSLNLSFTEIALIFSLPLALLAAFAGAGGFVADAIGPKRAAGIGAVLLGLGDVARSFSSNVVMLTGFTALIGIGLALCFPNLPKIIGTWFPPKLRGTASGVYGTGIMLGSAIALGATLPLVYPIWRTWNGVFLVWGLFSLIVSAVWWISMRKSPPWNPQSEAGRTSVREVIGNRSLWIVALLLLLDNMIYYVEVTDLLPYFAQLGATTENAAVLQSLVSLAGVPSIIMIPILSDRLGTRRPFLWMAAAISAASGFALALTPSALAPLNPIVLGVTNASMFLTCLILPIDLFPGRIAGTASGLVISVGYTGGLLGPAVAGYLADVSGGFAFVPILLGLLSLVIPPLTIFALKNPKNREPA